MMKFIRVIAGLALATSACLAIAAPTITDDQGFRSDEVRVSISESDLTKLLDPLTGDPLVAVQLRIDYVMSNLLFKTATVTNPSSFLLTSLVFGEYSEPGATTAVPGALSASLSQPFPANASPSGGFQLELTFQIQELAALGPTLVTFSCDKSGLSMCPDYVLDETSATVTVLDRPTTPIPLPGTLPLLGLGAAALWWTRRRIA